MQAYEEAERIKFETQLLRLNGIEREKVIALRKIDDLAESDAQMVAWGLVEPALTVDEIARSGETMKRVVGNAFKGMEDALVKFDRVAGSVQHPCQVWPLRAE